MRATATAASSALFSVCHCGCDLMLMCVVMGVFGLVTPAPSVGLPFTCEPSVYTKSFGFHFLVWRLVYRLDVFVYRCTGMGISL